MKSLKSIRNRKKIIEAIKRLEIKGLNKFQGGILEVIIEKDGKEWPIIRFDDDKVFLYKGVYKIALFSGNEIAVSYVFNCVNYTYFCKNLNKSVIKELFED